MDMKSFIRPTISVLLLTLTVLGLLNVYADNPAVMEKAKAAACADCSPAIAEVSKTPIKHSYSFRAEGDVMVVECQRPAIFFGEYQCEKATY